ncbi:hypothetical protein KCU71_g22512, partial [Aureobasidium melanogenum]
LSTAADSGILVRSQSHSPLQSLAASSAIVADCNNILARSALVSRGTIPYQPSDDKHVYENHSRLQMRSSASRPGPLRCVKSRKVPQFTRQEDQSRSTLLKLPKMTSLVGMTNCNTV